VLKLDHQVEVGLYVLFMAGRMTVVASGGCSGPRGGGKSFGQVIQIGPLLPADFQQIAKSVRQADVPYRHRTACFVEQADIG
jgi:hypothetical protein